MATAAHAQGSRLDIGPPEEALYSEMPVWMHGVRRSAAEPGTSGARAPHFRQPLLDGVEVAEVACEQLDLPLAPDRAGRLRGEVGHVAAQGPGVRAEQGREQGVPKAV